MFNRAPLNSASFNSAGGIPGTNVLSKSFSIVTRGGISIIVNVVSAQKILIAKTIAVVAGSTDSVRIARSFTVKSVQVFGASFVVESRQASVVSASFVVESSISYVILGKSFTVQSAQYIATAKSTKVMSLVSNGIDNVSKSWVVGSPITSAQSKISSNTAYLLLPDGDMVEFEGSIGFDEGAIYWRASLVVSPTAYTKIKVDDTVEIHINGDSYTLIVDSKNRSISDSRLVSEHRVEAVSKIAHKKRSVADSITITYDTDKAASEIMAELLAGYVIDWTIIDWNILANRLSVKNADLVETAQKIAEAAGAVIESKPNGDLLVRYKFPKSPAAYEVGVYDSLSTTSESVYQYSEQDSLGDFYNRVRVSDITPDVSYGDFIEHVPEKHFLHAYTVPFDPTATLSHTSDERISLYYIGVVYEVIGNRVGIDDEVLEVVNGKFTTKYPVFHIESFHYLYADLGGISFDLDSNVLYTANKTGYSLIRIVYTTRYIRYVVSGVGVEKAQFILNRN